ncbi:MAG: hydroxyethylthiazole kinase, partial [Desulfobacteraceae bacterium]
LVMGPDGKVLNVFNGHRWMGLVTGSGCAASALIGAFLAVDSDPVSASASALAFFGLAGEIAAAEALGPASFQVGLLDELYRIRAEQLEEGARIIS